MKEHSQSLPGIPEAQDLANLQAQMLRPARNVNIDGSFELGWGMSMFCLGLVPYINPLLPKSMWASWWTAWIGFLPLICGVFAIYGIPKLVKRFVTWPRTGYVANPGEVKLTQLVMLMVFGAALGLSLTMPFILVSEIREAISRQSATGDMPRILRHGVQLLVCATVAIWLGRKTITKRRPPVPMAYDAAVITQGLKQTPAGRTSLRTVKFTMLLLFAGIPIVVFGVAFGLMYLSKAVIHHAEIEWSQWGVAGFLVAANALLYLMCNAAAIRQQWWKWLVLAVMLVGPIMVAPLIPHPPIQTVTLPILEPILPVMLCAALVWVLSGAATVVWFIRHNPLPAAEAA